MYKFVLLLFSCNVLSNCSLQTKNLKSVENKIVKDAYFLGKWKENSVIFTVEHKEALQNQSPCNSKSYWEFKNEKSIVLQSFKTYNGKNCETFTNTKFSSFSVKSDRLQYFISDILYNTKYSITDKNTFKIYNEDFLNGKPVTIVKEYIRIK